MQCPYCRYQISADDLFCPHCGQEVLSATQVTPAATEDEFPPLADEPPTTLAARRLIGKSCPYCQSAITSGDEVIVCPQCDTPHHVDCWRENGGCTTFGCARGPQAAAIEVAAEPPGPPPFRPAYDAPAPDRAPALAVAIAEQERKALNAVIFALLGYACCPIPAAVGFVLAWQVFGAQNTTNVTGRLARVRATWAMILSSIAIVIWFLFSVGMFFSNP